MGTERGNTGRGGGKKPGWRQKGPLQNKGRGKGFHGHCRPAPRLERLPPTRGQMVMDLEEDNKFLTRQIVHLQHKTMALQQAATAAASSSPGTKRKCRAQQTDPGTPEGPGGPSIMMGIP